VSIRPIWRGAVNVTARRVIPFTAIVVARND
jgi:hypothetical protein